MKKCFLLLLALLMFTGCSSYTVIMGHEVNDNNLLSMEHRQFIGHKVESAKISGQCDLKVSIVTDSGNLNLSVTKKGEDSPIYESKNIQTSYFTIPVSEGEYIIRLEGEEHSGSYNINWE